MGFQLRAAAWAAACWTGTHAPVVSASASNKERVKTLTKEPFWIDAVDGTVHNILVLERFMLQRMLNL